ncbi:MAG: glutathione S-transferase family protein [Pseudomonadales bacterium]
MFKLYGTPLSPFVRKAMLALEYKGLEYESQKTFPNEKSEPFQSISPLGKIPVLDHDGFTIPDTSVICRYLDRIAPEKSLYPADAKEEARALWLEEYADTRLIENCAGVFQERLMKPRLLKQPTDEARLAGILDTTLPACLDYLESIVPESGYLVGDRLSIADLSVVTCFIQAQYGDFDVDGGRYPRLRRYLDAAYASPLVVNRMASERANLPPGM